MALRAEVIEDAGDVDLDRDRALVVRYQQGDEAAFDELYRRYYARLRTFCRRRVGDDFVAEELAQEAFTRALRAMPGFAGERRFYPWMTVIAQRLCVDHHRVAARIEPAAEIEDSVVDNDFDGVLDASDHAQLAQAMARIAPRHREALRLREQEGHTYQDMAAHFEVPVTTVEALLHRARKSLRREFLAISGGGRLASLPILGAAFAALGRLRARSSARTASFAELLPSASAGLAALGMAAVPALSFLSAPADATTIVIVPATAVTAPTPAAAPAPTDPVIVESPVAVETPAVAVAPPVEVPEAPPTPAIDLGVTHVYTDPAGAKWSGDQAEQMPISIVLSPTVRIGVDLTPILGATPKLEIKP